MYHVKIFIVNVISLEPLKLSAVLLLILVNRTVLKKESKYQVRLSL
jgi:hypothetical protein